MASKSEIEWTNATWNPWHGCKKVSPGCKYCYMYRDKERYNQEPTKVMKSKANFNAPYNWIEGRLIFTCSWSDFFIEEADIWRKEAWEIIRNTPQHTYQILTKRPERIKQCLPEDWGNGYDNVWLGVSVESQKETKRIQYLDMVPCKVRFLSVEPLLDEIDLTETVHGGQLWDPLSGWLDISRMTSNKIDWVIVGGESGNNTGKYRFRPCKLEWIYKIANQCRQNKTPLFIKQLGTYLAQKLELKDRHGKDINEFPEGLKIRQFPK